MRSPEHAARLRPPHAFGLAETLDLARALGRAPRRVTAYGIEGERFGAGEELSAPVRGAMEPVAAELRSWLASPIRENY